MAKVTSQSAMSDFGIVSVKSRLVNPVRELRDQRDQGAPKVDDRINMRACQSQEIRAPLKLRI